MNIVKDLAIYNTVGYVENNGFHLPTKGIPSITPSNYKTTAVESVAVSSLANLVVKPITHKGVDMLVDQFLPKFDQKIAAYAIVDFFSYLMLILGSNKLYTKNYMYTGKKAAIKAAVLAGSSLMEKNEK